MLVEDDPTNLKLLTYILRPCGYQLYTAKGGNQALEIVEKHRPDLILLDIRLPDIDGFQVFKKLKAQEETKGIPIIFVSALAQKKYRVKGLSLGAADYIVKPYMKEDIIVSIKEILKLRKLENVQ